MPLSACAYHPGDVADPNAITLRAAVFDVADTLAETRQRTLYRDKAGMYLDQATVEFYIAAKSTETDTLKLDTTVPTAVLGLPLTAMAQSQLQNEGSRSNKITLTFKNIISTKMSPAQIERCLTVKPTPRECNVIFMKPAQS
jgi:hypothetical protein